MANTISPNTEYYSYRQVAAKLGVSETHIATLVSRGQLVAYDVSVESPDRSNANRRRRIAVADLEAFMESRRIPTAAEIGV